MAFREIAGGCLIASVRGIGAAHRWFAFCEPVQGTAAAKSELFNKANLCQFPKYCFDSSIGKSLSSHVQMSEYD